MEKINLHSCCAEWGFKRFETVDEKQLLIKKSYLLQGLI